jgi:DNA-binding transcriptional regulator YdaS (Cro superfamily)
MDALKHYGIRRLAKQMQVSHAAVWNWIARKKIPADRVIEIERLTGIRREELRPDLYTNINSEESQND